MLHDDLLNDPEGQEGEDSAEKRGCYPRENNFDDFVPVHCTRANEEPHADDATDNRMGRRDWQSPLCGHSEPDGGCKKGGHEAIHQFLRIFSECFIVSEI